MVVPAVAHARVTVSGMLYTPPHGGSKVGLAMARRRSVIDPLDDIADIRRMPVSVPVAFRPWFSGTPVGMTTPPVDRPSMRRRVAFSSFSETVS